MRSEGHNSLSLMNAMRFRTNALQFKKTGAKRPHTCELRNHFHQFDNKCNENTHNTTKYRILMQTLTT